MGSDYGGLVDSNSYYRQVRTTQSGEREDDEEYSGPPSAVSEFLDTEGR